MEVLAAGFAKKKKKSIHKHMKCFDIFHKRQMTQMALNTKMQ